MPDNLLETITQYAQPDIDWEYALITLVYRFFAVFAVLWLIQAGMQVSAYFIKKSEASATKGDATASSTAAATETPTSDAGTPDDLTLAAIGVARELESHPEAFRVADDRRASTWAVAGRVTAKRNPAR